MQPGHGGSCSGFIRTLRSTRAPSASIRVRCSAAKSAASIRSVLRKTGSSGSCRVEHALAARRVDLARRAAAREVGDDVELGLEVQAKPRKSRSSSAQAAPRARRRQRADRLDRERAQRQPQRRRGGARARALEADLAQVQLAAT